MISTKPFSILSALVFGFAVTTVPESAQAEISISVYGGFQTAPHSNVDDGDAGFSMGWEGRPFEMPPYYGLRATWWMTENIGIGVDLNHAKVYGVAADMAAAGYDRFEFTDGHNLVTANIYRRFSWSGSDLAPYIGAGVGVAVPHVDAERAGVHTFGYQITGPAVTAIAGLSYPLGDRAFAFGEYKGSYSGNEIDLDSGMTLNTDIITNAINIGIGLHF